MQYYNTAAQKYFYIFSTQQEIEKKINSYVFIFDKQSWEL